MMIGDSTRVMHTVSGIIDGCFDHIIHFSGPSEVVILLVNDILFLHDILNIRLLCRLRIGHVYYPFSQLVDSLTALARTRMDIPTARASQNQPTHLEGPLVSAPITNPKFSIVWQCKSRNTKPQHASTTLIRRRDWRSVMISPFLSPGRVRCWSSWSGRGFGKRWS